MCRVERGGLPRVVGVEAHRASDQVPIRFVGQAVDDLEVRVLVGVRDEFRGILVGHDDALAVLADLRQQVRKEVGRGPGRVALHLLAALGFRPPQELVRLLDHDDVPQLSARRVRPPMLGDACQEQRHHQRDLFLVAGADPTELDDGGPLEQLAQRRRPLAVEDGARRAGNQLLDSHARCGDDVRPHVASVLEVVGGPAHLRDEVAQRRPSLTDAAAVVERPARLEVRLLERLAVDRW